MMDSAGSQESTGAHLIAFFALVEKHGGIATKLLPHAAEIVTMLGITQQTSLGKIHELPLPMSTGQNRSTWMPAWPSSAAFSAHLSSRSAVGLLRSISLHLHSHHIELTHMAAATWTGPGRQSAGAAARCCLQCI